MKALQLPQNDQERMRVLNTIYMKGLTTPKEELAFSSDLLVYLRPFISKLNSAAAAEDSNVNMSLVRSVVDELIADIVGQIEGVCQRMEGKRAAHLAAEYGLDSVFNPFEADFYYSAKAA